MDGDFSSVTEDECLKGSNPEDFHAFSSLSIQSFGIKWRKL